MPPTRPSGVIHVFPMNPAPRARIPEKTLALFALLAGGAAIAFAPIFVRISDTGPVASAFWRVALAVAPLWLLTRWSERGRGAAASTGFAWPVVLAGLFFAGDLGVWHLSILYTTIANSTLLANFAPIFVTLGGWLLFRQRVTRLFLIGMVTALAGATVLIGPSFGVSGRHLAGDALGVLTAVFYGAYFLAIKHLRASTISTARIMAWSSAITAIALLPVALVSGEVMLPHGAHGWMVLFGLALLCQVAGQGLIAWAMAHLPASFSAVSLLIQPVLATSYAWMILGERIGPVQFVGAAIVLVGIYFARRGS